MTGYGATISFTVKAALLALAAIADLAVFLGLIRPRVTPVTDPKANDGTPLVPGN